MVNRDPIIKQNFYSKRQYLNYQSRPESRLSEGFDLSQIHLTKNGKIREDGRVAHWVGETGTFFSGHSVRRTIW